MTLRLAAPSAVALLSTSAYANEPAINWGYFPGSKCAPDRERTAAVTTPASQGENRPRPPSRRPHVDISYRFTRPPPHLCDTVRATVPSTAERLD